MANSKVTGLKEAIAYNERVATTLKPEAEKILSTDVRVIFAESQKIVPEQTGELKRSGHVVPISGGQRIEYTAEHAERIHEDLTMRHEPGETAKYVERPHLAKIAALKKKMEEVIKKK